MLQDDDSEEHSLSASLGKSRVSADVIESLQRPPTAHAQAYLYSEEREKALQRKFCTLEIAQERRADREAGKFLEQPLNRSNESAAVRMNAGGGRSRNVKTPKPRGINPRYGPSGNRSPIIPSSRKQADVAATSKSQHGVAKVARTSMEAAKSSQSEPIVASTQAGSS
jgi:hypothetical protein